MESPSGAGAPRPSYASVLPEPYRDLRRRVRVEAAQHEERPKDLVKVRHAGEPELPEIHVKDVLCIGPIIANSLYWLLGKEITYALLTTHLTLLLAIRPSITSLVAAGAAVHDGRLPLWVPLLIALPIRFSDDPFLYWAGRRYGDRLTNYMIEQDPRWKGAIARGERAMERWGIWAILGANTVIPLPASVLYFIAGDSRMSIAAFVIADIVGLELYAGGLVLLGYLLGGAADAVVTAIGVYGTYLFWGTIVMIVVYVVISVRRSMRLMRDREAAAARRTTRPPLQ